MSTPLRIMMMPLFFGGLPAASAPSSPHPLSLECRLLAPDGASMVPVGRVYTGRRDRLVLVKGDTFLDLRYDAYAGQVGVTVLEIPHAPFSFGEKIIEKEQILSLNGPSPRNSVTLESLTPHAQLTCGEH